MSDDTSRERARQVARELCVLLGPACITCEGKEEYISLCNVNSITDALLAFADAENEACEQLVRERANRFNDWPLIAGEHDRAADAIARRRSRT